MAEIRPLTALHYDLDRVGSLADVTAPPYDVIDDADRAALLARDPHNVVELDLPVDPAGGDCYEHAAHTLGAWKADGILRDDPSPALWAQTQDYVGPDGRSYTRHGFYAAVRVTDYGPGRIRPHERTQPGPKEDRLRLTRATRHNLSPIFTLVDADAWSHLEPHLDGPPWGEVTDPDGTVHRLWRVGDEQAIAAVTDALADAELLIADGHHRYETARVYAEEIGGDGPHRWVLMNLVSLSDPGLSVFPTHRVVSGLSDDAALDALAEGLSRDFDVEPVASVDEAFPAGAEGVGVFGYADRSGRALRLRLRDENAAAEAMPGKPASYRRLDPAICESLILRGLLGKSEDDVEAKRGLAYARSDDEVAPMLAGGHDAAILLRSTPVEQVREVAADGEVMPPKSTFFVPKLLTGLLFNPLA